MKEVVINYFNKDFHYFKISPLQFKRKWLDEVDEKFGYRCIPLRVANEYGWEVLSPVDFTVSWYGGNSPVNVSVTSTDKNFFEEKILTHFGYGTFTLELDFLIKTPEGYSSYLRGVPNKTYGILKPLDAMVETDWLPYPFTYNFLFMEPGTVEFKKNEPLFSFFPIERGTVENFKIRSEFIQNDSELFEDFNIYAESREKHTAKRQWHIKHYLKGIGPNKNFNVKNHITKLFFGRIDK